MKFTHGLTGPYGLKAYPNQKVDQLSLRIWIGIYSSDLLKNGHTIQPIHPGTGEGSGILEPAHWGIWPVTLWTLCIGRWI